MATQPNTDVARWQREADLLAEGREVVERLCRSTRWRYLYPDGPSLAVLLAAYQEFDRRRTVGRVRGGRWRQRRAFRALVRRHLRADVQARSHRLSYGYPLPRLRRLPPPPQVVRRALARVDADARPLIASHIGGDEARMGMTLSHDAAVATSGAASRGIEQFRDALINEALSDPDAIRALHVQHLHMLATAPPTVRRHPVATLLLVKLPLQLLVGLFAVLLAGYFGAYAFFNDAVLGRFVSARVSGLVEGDLEMESIHWRPRLVVDLLTGTPSPIDIDGVTVWGPYKRTNHGRTHRTAHADRLEVRLMLGEIIPWTRLGIPAFIDIPWLLHFTEIRNEGEVWLDIREAKDTLSDGTEVTYLSLINAFMPLESHPERKGLSFAVDDAVITDMRVEVDSMQVSQWRAGAQLDEARFSLGFEQPDPLLEGPIELPLAFSLSGRGPRGSLDIIGIEFPLTDLEIHNVEGGVGDTPFGDVSYSMSTRAAGSKVTLDGALRDAFARKKSSGPEPPPRVDLLATSKDADRLFEHVVAGLALPPATFVGHDSSMTATVTGDLSDPTYTLATNHLSLDLLEESAWVADDVEVALAMADAPIPGMWEDRFDPGETRNVVTFDVLRGTALDGTFALAERDAGDPDFPDDVSAQAHVVMPLFEEDSYLISIPLRLEGLNPAQLVPSDPDLATTLAGVATGVVDIERLALGPDPAASHIAEAPTLMERIDIRMDDVRVRRDRGPQQDNLPRDLTLDGSLSLGGDDVLTLDPLTIRSPGTVLQADGRMNIELPRLEGLGLDLRIDDGAAFARSFDIPSYFGRLRARTVARGPVGAPSASDGQLTVLGLLNPGSTTKASFSMSSGTLKLKVDATDARLFGGTGKVSAEIDVFEGGSLSNDPRIKAYGSLRGVELSKVTDGRLQGRATVEFEVGDARGEAARLSELRVSGEATSEAVSFGGTTYRDATVAFDLDTDEVAISRLTLPIHRPVSPHFASDVTVPVGEIVVDGTLSLDADPVLNLDVDARNVPMATVARLLDADLGVYGQLASTQLVVGGTVGKPRVDGEMSFAGLSASGIALGAGTLEIHSEDYPGSGPLAEHRELRVQGELQQSRGDSSLLWSLDSVVAIGTAASGSSVVEAQVDVEFDKVTLATLLRDPVDPSRSPPVEGELDEVSAHLLACNRDVTMLSDCVGVEPAEDQDLALSVAFAVESAWMRSATDPLPKGADPCDSPSTLCTAGALAASVEWPVVRLEQPWRVRSGGAEGATLALSGAFDLSEVDPAGGKATPGACEPPPLSGRPLPPADPAGDTRAEIRGTIDLAPLAALAKPYGVGDLSGRLRLGIAISGPVRQPVIDGRASLAGVSSGAPTPMGVMLYGLASDECRAVLDAAERKAPLSAAQLDALEACRDATRVTFPDLRLEVDDGWILADGEATMSGSRVVFGSVRGEHTGYAFDGACSGTYAASATGRISANMVADVVGPPVVGGPGGIDLEQLRVQGSTQSEDPMPDVLDATLAFNRSALAVEFSQGVTSARFDRGRIAVHRCTSACAFGDRGWYRINIGGAGEAGAAQTQPATALRVSAGTRGRGWAWGRAYIDPQFERSAGVDVQVRLDSLPYRAYDTVGRPVYEVEVTTGDLALEGGTPLVATGRAEVDRARYVKDAVQGVEILAFTDDSPEIEEAPPELLQGMTFDIRVETDRPFRIENNVASGLQADAVVQVTGTYEAPEFTGRLDFEPGGTVDIPFLTGTYEIQRGRVTLLREIEDAEVDVLALRNEPIYIEDQPRSVTLSLGGTLSAIRWSCITDGGGGELDTVRGCTEYLVLGAGDVQLSETDVQQFGAGGLAGVRKPLQVVGHLTEFDVGERAGEAAPRLDPYVPDVRLRLGQIGPELEIATPTEWLDFDYGRATIGWDYTRGYPGFLLRQSRETSVKLDILDPITIEYSRRSRSYLNERVIFDPLRQESVELRFDFDVPSLR
ncbi:MAG: hypothetical protein ACE37F_11915 [Nannocystaceae bacterium]|nr:translocation/assembly module TamB [bacterium]